MMRAIFLLLPLLLVFPLGQAQSETLQNFETDYCTMFANGTPQHPDLWKRCCFEHDLRYWFGGRISDRDTADIYLKQCVHDVAGGFWAEVIYNGVLNGHKSPIQHRLHWGWGWAPHRDNLPLTTQEKTEIRTRLHQLNLDPRYVDQFICKYRLAE